MEAIYPRTNSAIRQKGGLTMESTVNRSYLKALCKVTEAKKEYNALKNEPYTSEILERMAECRAIIGVWGTELRRLESQN